MARKKYSPNFERDYNFYLKNIDKFDFIGSDVKKFRPPEGSNSVKKTFHIFDSQGKLIPCEDPDLFLKILKFKKGLNFWIKQWAEGFFDLGENMDWYLKDLEGEIPDWVYESFSNQIAKNNFFEKQKAFIKKIKKD